MISRFNPSRLKNSLIIFHVLSAFVGFFIYFVNYKISEDLLIQKRLSRQLIVAKSGSLAIENLLKNIQSQISSFLFSFTDIDEFSSIDIDKTRNEFSTYIQKSELPINDIALYGKNGKLLIIENREHVRTGESQDFSQAEFIKWSMNPPNKNKIFISTPYLSLSGSSLGKAILILAEPMYFGNTYKGTLAIRLLIDNFKTAYVTPLTPDTESDTFVVNKNGVLLAGNNALLNKNLFTYATDKKWSHYQEFISRLKMALKRNTTQTTWNFQNPNSGAKLLLVGISRIDIPNTDQDLYLVVSSSQEEVVSSLKSLRYYGIAWLGFGILTTTVGSLIIILLGRSE